MANRYLTLSVATIVGLWFLLPVPLRAEIEVLHDRFSGDVTVRTKPTVASAKPSFLLVGAYEADGQPSVAINLFIKAQSWVYLQCHRTYWLVDGKPFQLPQPTHDGRVHSGYVIEFLVISPVTINQIEQLAQAKKVEFKVCNDEYTANTTEMNDFRVFLSKLREFAPKKSP